MTALRRLAFLAAALSISGCVEAVPGLPVSAPAGDAVDYSVTTSVVGDAPIAQGVAGALDVVEVRTDSLVLAGWAPASSGELVVIAPVSLELTAQRRLRRPDAAAAIRHPRDDLGFQLVLAGSVGAADDVCMLFRPAETEPWVQLARSGDTACST